MRTAALATVLIIVTTGIAPAQHGSKPRAEEARCADSKDTHAGERYDIRSFGVFCDLIMRGDFAPKIALADAMAHAPSTGVGALSGARGEITVADGKLIVSYGKEGAHPSAANESAALLATGRARAWRSIRVEADVAPAAVQEFLARSAGAHGLDPDKSFPFQLRGSIGPYAMHVNAAPTDGPHGMGLPMAIQVERKGDAIDGGVAGLYVSPALVGIVTHGGERMHAHWISADGQSTAHLDLWGIKAGTLLLLPEGE